MDLSVVYSKTAKGLRARASLLGGLPSHLMKVLTHVDGISKAESILIKFDEITEHKLIVALNLLEREGYIKPVMVTVPSENDWAPATIFAPMEVEEFENVEEVEVKAKENAQLQAERKAQAEEEARQQAEIKAREKEEQALEKAKIKEKLRAEAKVKAQLEADRITREKEEARKKAEAVAQAKAEEEARIQAEQKAKAAEEARLKAEAEAKAKAEEKEHVRREIERISREAEAEHKKAEEEARAKAALKAREELEQAHAKAMEEARLQAEREAKEIEEARLQAELKARDEAEKAHAKAEAEAKENARRELERIGREAEEAQRKAEAEAIAKAEAEAKLEAERKAKAEEKARLKAEAEEKAKAAEQIKIEEKEKARLEIARIVREAEEARKKSEAKAKESRLETKRKAKAEQEARLKVERKPKAEVKQAITKTALEEKASVDANLNSRLEMERFALEAEEGRKKSKAEARAKAEEAESKAQAEAALIRVKAEEQAKADAKETSRLEMERISREADEIRKKQNTETHTNIEVALISDTKGRSWEEIEEEEERAFKEEERAFEEEEHATKEDDVERVIEKITRQEAERLELEKIQRQAKEEVEALAKNQAKISLRSLNYGKWLSRAGKAIKPILVYLPLVIILLIGVLHLINLSMLVAPIEKLASESVGEEVSIERVHASLWPHPHLELGNVKIGINPSSKTEGLKIETVHISPVTSTLFQEVKMLNSIELEGMTFTQDNFGQPLQWINSLGKAEHLKIEQINLKNTVIQIRDLELGTFSGTVKLTEARELKNIALISAEQTLSVQVTPQGSNFDVVLTGTDWHLPVNPKFVFNELKAKGTLSQNQIIFSQIEGNIYGGTIKGKAAVDWSSEWSTAGNFELFNATLPQMLNAFGSSASIDGKLALTGTFSCRSPQAINLVDSPEITANFELHDGKINDIDLARAVLFKGSQSLVGGATHFDKFTGSLQLKSGYYQYKQLVLETNQFHARGNLDILPNQEVSGKISANLTAQSRRLYANFNLAGKAGDIKRQ
jgi:hypothetical protein